MKILDETSTNNSDEHKGKLHITLMKLNNVAENVPGVVKSINDGIEVRVENIVHPVPQEYGMVRSSVKGAAQLVSSVGREVGGFAGKVRQAASEMGRHTSEAIRSTLRNSINRLTGKRPATTESSSTEAMTEATSNAEPSAEAATAAAELVEATTAAT